MSSQNEPIYYFQLLNSHPVANELREREALSSLLFFLLLFTEWKPGALFPAGMRYQPENISALKCIV